MKVIKKIFLFVLSIIIIAVIIGLFLPKKYSVVVSETINKPKKEVFDYVKLLKNQEKYSVWVMEDKNLKPEYTGIVGTVGATEKWNSQNKNVGEGMQTIAAMTEDRIDYDLSFIRPMESKAKSAYVLKSISENQTEISAEFYGENAPFPFTFLSNFAGKYFITDAQTKNLANLKAILEK